MTLRFAILASIVAAAMIYGLYEVEHAVRRLDRELASLQENVAREREAIRVLNAEWSYLTEPSRLQDLVSKYSELRLIEPDQTVTSAAFFADPVPAPEADAASAPTPAVKPVVGDTRISFVREEAGNAQ